MAVAVRTDVGVAVELGRILATGEGVGSSEHPARSMATRLKLPTSQIVITLARVALQTVWLVMGGKNQDNHTT